MDKSTLPGLALGFGALILSVILEGGSLAALLNVPAAVLVFGGTFFAGPHVGSLFGDFGQNLGFSLFLSGTLMTVTVGTDFPQATASDPSVQPLFHLISASAHTERGTS